MTTTTSAPAEARRVQANGTELYCEIRGAGPAVLCISGATGDAAHYQQVAGSLADEFTVITYDRRGNSRSPRPQGWAKTTPQEQADDAAGLLAALGIGQAVVFGSSGGAIIGAWLTTRYPELVRGAVLHEPALLGVLADPGAVMAGVQPLIDRALATGGPAAAVEAFVRYVAGSITFERLPPDLRARMLGNGETLFGVEFGALESSHPGEDALAAVRCPVTLLVGTESAPFFAEAARWLAARLGTTVVEIPGAHAPYFDRPEQFAGVLRPYLRHIVRAAL